MMKRFLWYLAVGAVMASLMVPQVSYAFSGMSGGKKPGQGAPAQGSEPPPIAGKVTQTMNSGGYTYVLVEGHGQKTWVAVPETKVKVGEEVAFYPGVQMANFKSDTLGRTFEKIVFSPGVMVLPGAKGEKAVAVNPKGGSSAPKVSAGKVNVEKAAGPDAYTVSELYKDKARLDKHKVVVRGKVVKVSLGIMGTNWVHVQDGTGDLEQGTDNLVVTSDDTPSVGDVVTVKGTLSKDKDFGYGYKYDVIVEKASIKK